jgi:folate-binding protein YgfZ
MDFNLMFSLPNAFQTPPLRLLDYGILRIEGPDAATFLQGQLTSHVLAQTTQGARLSAYCSPKGRVLTSGVLLKTGETRFDWVLPLASVAQTLKRLRLFVLRAKVTLSDQTLNCPLVGWLNPPQSIWGATTPQTWVWTEAYPQWTLPETPDTWFVRLPPVEGVERVITIQPNQVSISEKEERQKALWDYLVLRSGVLWVGPEQVDQWIPQMLHYESLGAIHFQKGCYTGQEVIARSQFRGQIKRRLQLLRSPFPLQIGDALGSHPNFDPEDAMATVIQSQWAPVPGSDSDYLIAACLPISSDPSAENVFFARGHDQALVSVPLPYPLKKDI